MPTYFLSDNIGAWQATWGLSVSIKKISIRAFFSPDERAEGAFREKQSEITSEVRRVVRKRRSRRWAQRARKERSLQAPRLFRAGPGQGSKTGQGRFRACRARRNGKQDRADPALIVTDSRKNDPGWIFFHPPRKGEKVRGPSMPVAVHP
jgi:hypothetical protein